MTADVAILVLAKAPVPGRVKTRLCPPCTPAQAADLAAAALADTLDTVLATPARRRVLVLDGRPWPGLQPAVDVVPQRGRGLDERLAAAFADAAGGGPALLVGMDTPQLTPALLARAASLLTAPGVDAVLGPADDGGWWAAGLRHPDPLAFLGVPMSTAATGAAQRARLEGLGLAVAPLPALRDVDTVADAAAVAAAAPGTRFARRLAEIGVVPAALAAGRPA